MTDQSIGRLFMISKNDRITDFFYYHKRKEKGKINKRYLGDCCIGKATADFNDPHAWGERLLQALTLIGQKALLSSSCPIIGREL